MRHAFGNKQVVTASGLAAGASGLAAQARPTTATFDARGQFATTIANALGESETWSYNADFGTPASHTGPNGVATAWAYDTFGRPVRESRADGTQTLYAYVYCAGVNGGGAVCPTNGAYYVDARPVAADGVTANGAETRSYYDTLSRVIAADTAAFDSSAGAWIRGDTLYDGFGRVAQASRPYLLGVDAPVWTVSSYIDASGRNDPLARAWSVTAPDGSVTRFTYDALTTSVTNADLATTTTVKNAQGLIARVTDALGQPTTYSYDAFGDMTTANPPGTAIVRYTYDLRGRKLSASDSDMGTWTYSYDAFGALATQTDAKGQTSTMAYDLLGRLVSRAEPDMVSSWSYGTSASHHNIDQLSSASCTGAACASGYTRSYLYDSLARLARTTIAVNGASYYTIPTYDPTTGKLASLRNFSGFTVNYTYTARGYLSAISDASTPSLVYWTANARNAEMQLTQSTAGNGVVTFDSYDPLTGRMLNVCATPHAGACDGADANISTDFDPVGNLTTRGDTLHGVTESFTYDPLNRLTASTLANGGAPVTRTTAYNSAGSITKKSDICNTTNCFAYTGAAPHAVSSIAGTYEGITNPNFYYDPNGNMVCVTTLTACDASAAKTVTWTSFNMVSSVKEGTTTVSLAYDSEHSRAQQTESEGATLYFNDTALGAMAERFQPTTGAVTWRNYILADGKIVAERTSTGATVKVRYFVLDHLGSTVALTDETAHLVESDAYDAWGKQRNAATGADDTTCTIPATSFSNRGFTGHEEMPDGLCLTNMNARIYDPAIGRFMSPDDVIPDLYNGQSYNRYTYVDDNPLSYTDPTGHYISADETIVVDGPKHKDLKQMMHNFQENSDSPSESPLDNSDRQLSFPVSLTTSIMNVFAHGLQHSQSTGTTATSGSPSGLIADNPFGDSLPTSGPQGASNMQVADDDDDKEDEIFDDFGSLARIRFKQASNALQKLDPDNQALENLEIYHHQATEDDVLRVEHALEHAREDIAHDIAQGHAFMDHADELGIGSEAEFELRVREIISSSKATTQDLGNGRAIEYHLEGTTVIINYRGGEGTMFPESEEQFRRRKN